MKKPRYRCVVCGKPISPARAKLALERGRVPRFDSDTCANTDAKRRYRAKERERKDDAK